MYNKLINKTLRIFSVPVILFIFLLPFSFLTGWNSATAVIYWLFLFPFVAEYVPTIFSTEKNQLKESLIGLLIFYSFMLFMTYKNYDSDFFFIMMLSAVINVGSISTISKVKGMYRNPSY
jgi:hypothetical protein